MAKVLGLVLYISRRRDAEQPSPRAQLDGPVSRRKRLRPAVGITPGIIGLAMPPTRTSMPRR